MNTPLEVREVLVCDDIRREDNGKAILIGVYVGDIVANSFPLNLRLCFWLQGHASKGIGARDAQFKIELTNQDVEPLYLNAKFDAPPEDKVGGVLVFAGVPLIAKQPGHLVLSVKVDGDNWLELMRKGIVVRSDSEQTS
jgi:hypothetical protein